MLVACTTSMNHHRGNLKQHKVPVIVEVPGDLHSPRKAFWSAGYRWPIGRSVREVTAEQLAELQSDALQGYLSVHLSP